MQDMRIMTFLWLTIAPATAYATTRPALAQSPTSGTMVPVAAPAASAEPSQHEHQKHGQRHHRGKTKALTLPADERYASLSQATSHCPAGTVEWASLGGSVLYHNSQSRWFGKTKHGAYACKAALTAAGFRLGK